MIGYRRHTFYCQFMPVYLCIFSRKLVAVVMPPQSFEIPSYEEPVRLGVGFFLQSSVIFHIVLEGLFETSLKFFRDELAY